MNWPSEKQFLAFALGLIAVLLLAVCERDGMEGGTVIEDADSMLCLCRKKSDPALKSVAAP